MSPFRYGQFCALARAAEILGERWTLLLIRDLLSGPLRFADLRRRLRGISSSVLSSRLSGLERRGLLRARRLGPPRACSVYELTELGKGLEPALLALTRWGARLLETPRPDDQLEPAWLVGALKAFARRGQVPRCRIALEIAQADEICCVGISGGARGTRVGPARDPVDARIRVQPRTLLGILTGTQAADGAIRAGTLHVSGDPTSVAKLPALFEFTNIGTPVRSDRPSQR